MEKLPFYLNSKTSKFHWQTISASHSEAAFRRCSSKHLCSYLFLLNFIKKRLQHRCFHENIAKFLRKAFFIEHYRWLLVAYHYLSKLILRRTFSYFLYFNLSQHATQRRSRSQMFFKIGVFKIFCKFGRKYLCWNLYLIQ